MKKIIVPTDFSETASHALDFAIDFNRKIKGEIILMHVVELPSYTYSTMGEMEMGISGVDAALQREYLKGIEEKLADWTERVSNEGQESRSVMRYGNPYQNISKEIAKEKANWIVMGSKGASGLSEVFIGSNAERVVRHAECPVFVIKGKTRIDDMKNIVFGSDLSEEQDLVAQKVKDIQELLHLNVHLVKAKTPHNFLMADAVEKQLEDFAKRNFLENYTLNSIEADYSDLGIIKFAEEVNAGLIVVGTHGKTGLAHLFGGSRAEDLVNESKIPVLTFKITL
ncbi:MAG: universal stress protein [Cyclobacteriaceae bacterium]